MFTKEPKGTGKYANFKKGEIIHNKESFTHMEGLIVWVEATDAEYQGEKYTKINVTLRASDGKTEVILGFPLGSGYGQNFFAMLPNIKAKLPVKISGGTDKGQDGKEYGRMYIQQPGEGGKYTHLKHFYTSKSEKKMPSAEPILHKGKEVGKDWSKRDGFCMKLLTAFEKQIVKANGKYTKPENVPVPPTQDEDFDDDMLF